MRILWFTWKDKKNPQAGGAELLDSEMAKKLAENGHEVTFMVAGFKGGLSEEMIDGYKVVRVGDKWSVYWMAFRYYRKYLEGWADLVIDECNTLPFFCKLYVKEKSVFWIQQFAREIWFYQMSFPLSLVGYLLEPLYLRLLSDQQTFTFAQSTKNDLISYGFRPDKVAILKETFVIDIPEDYRKIEKYPEQSILFLSALRAMKRPHHVIWAFEIAKRSIPNLKLYVAGTGSGKYFKRVLRLMSESPYKDDIIYLGKVNMTGGKKLEVLRKVHYICCPSVREGWGIIVSEAGSQGTPAIVYNVSGLKDAIDYGRAGLLCQENTPVGMAQKIVEGFSESFDYQALQERVVEFSKEVNVDKSCAIFLESIKGQSK